MQLLSLTQEGLAVRDKIVEWLNDSINAAIFTGIGILLMLKVVGII